MNYIENYIHLTGLNSVIFLAIPQSSWKQQFEKLLIFVETQDLILKHILNHNYATRFEIDELLFNILPDHKNEKQRKISISNIIREMAGSLIENIGSRTKPKWVLLKN